MPQPSIADLGVAELLQALSTRRMRAEELVRALGERIEREEPRVQAWEHLDLAGALREARRVDALPRPPPLAGLPIGVKDIVDTAGMPTELGTPIHRGRVPGRNAAVVDRLVAAGAIVLGKTVTTEFAFYRPGKTRNPLDSRRTPGGSSSGSAAAVAAGMVPAALGTQTAGSVVRPASFCGVVGMKVTHAAVPLDGVSALAPSLDALGLFVRHPGDLPPLLQAVGAGAPEAGPPTRPPRFLLCRTAQWSLAGPETRLGVEGFAGRLAAAGAAVAEPALPAEFDLLFEAQKTVMAAEAARTFEVLRRTREADLSPVLLDLLRAGEAVPDSRYRAALDAAAWGREALARLLDGADAILTPAAIGEAPLGLESTGDPAFNRVWTLLGAPCLSLPAGVGPSGMPIGVQLVGRPGEDHALASVAAWASGAARRG